MIWLKGGVIYEDTVFFLSPVLLDFFPHCCFVFLGAAFDFLLEGSVFSSFFFGVAFVSEGALFFLPGFNLITGVNEVDSDVNSVQLKPSVAYHVASLYASGFAFFAIERLMVNPSFNLF